MHNKIYNSQIPLSVYRSSSLLDAHFNSVFVSSHEDSTAVRFRTIIYDDDENSLTNPNKIDFIF